MEKMAKVITRTYNGMMRREDTSRWWHITTIWCSSLKLEIQQKELSHITISLVIAISVKLKGWKLFILLVHPYTLDFVTDIDKWIIGI